MNKHIWRTIGIMVCMAILFTAASATIGCSDTKNTVGNEVITNENPVLSVIENPRFEIKQTGIGAGESGYADEELFYSWKRGKNEGAVPERKLELFGKEHTLYYVNELTSSL